MGSSCLQLLPPFSTRGSDAVTPFFRMTSSLLLNPVSQAASANWRIGQSGAAELPWPSPPGLRSAPASPRSATGAHGRPPAPPSSSSQQGLVLSLLSSERLSHSRGRQTFSAEGQGHRLKVCRPRLGESDHRHTTRQAGWCSNKTLLTQLACSLGVVLSPPPPLPGSQGLGVGGSLCPSHTPWHPSLTSPAPLPGPPHALSPWSRLDTFPGLLGPDDPLRAPWTGRGQGAEGPPCRVRVHRGAGS